MTYFFLKMDEQKFHEEGHIVARMEAVPDCQE